ncbi:MAG: FAD-dependent oxidoreductase [Dehalococcoidia bacterium]|jgi:heterodisulfide reductase subunit A-like polyferredoxin
MDKTTDKKTGAVLVQGGGIAGIQAALDLANSGFKVYLIERSPAIGGMMSHLDKTFPTGDCATCIVSPKLVECARNINVEILTLSELVDLEGQPGNFKATVKRYPRYVDEVKCTACEQCTDACPVNVPNLFDRNMGTRKAIAKYYAQATPNIFGILKNGHAPCKVTCPANINVQGYIQLIKKKEYVKAVNLIRERNPLSAICGRACNHPCEAVCTRNSVDSPVAIRLLKRFASDKEMELVEAGLISLPEEKSPPAGTKKVGVIGAGPAGLTATADLADRGFAVTVYEATAAAGGMLRWGIPEYRLPKNILDYEVELIRRKGVTFKYNCNVGRDITLEQIRRDNEAVFAGVGVQTSRKLGVEGEDKAGIDYGVEFLRQAGDKDNPPEVKDRVIVIGGGNVAVDVARTALRLGAGHVDMVSLEQRQEMPALPEEIEATLEEGITVHNGWGPQRILGNGKVEGIEFKLCTSVFDKEGRFSPAYDTCTLTSLKADQVIIAIGQSLDKGFLDNKDVALERGVLKADAVTLETSVKGLFAGGDSVSGPGSIIQAVAAGKRAAESIERYLKGEDMRTARFSDSVRPIPEELLPTTKDKEKKPREVPGEIAVEERKHNFVEVEGGFSEEQALAECERCLNCAMCSECQECVAACEQNAIDHFMLEKTVRLDVGSVILAPGFEEFAAERKGEFGFGRYPNVMTSVQFERMLSASGPFEGNVIRRSDGEEAKRIAWIQCVGSRDSKCGNDYCSSVCCMVSTKQALIASDHSPDLQASVFYMDIRAHGKDFDQYYERARNQGNINYIKSMPSRVLQVPGSKDLRLQYYDESGKLAEADFDLVVLSVGMEPGAAARSTAGRIGIDLNEYGFCATDRFSPLSTSKPGVFVAGAFQEPKDIPETVTQASAAASMSMELLASARNSLVTKRVYPNEHDVTDEEPRIGVFICHCGKNIASVVDVEHVAEVAAQQPNVVFATHTMYTCADSNLNNIRDMIHEHRLNRIVVASCTPRTHEPIFRDTLREAGLNPYLFELANIRDQCSWVHSAEPEKATEKAIELMKMSVARSRLLSPLVGTSFAVNQTGLVIGGGVSGMTAALALANQGFKVHLVERSERLGGNALNLNYTLELDDVRAFVSGLTGQVERHENITLHLETEASGVAGFIGSFEVTLSREGLNKEVKCGAIIVATGAGPAATREFLYGKSDRVLTQVELEKKLARKAMPLKEHNIVMIQCVGSRNDERPYCSRICCSMAVKNALKIKQQDPTTNVYVLYRDIRTYGFREKYYKQAREAGVVFIRYERDVPPVVSDGRMLTVTVNSPDFPEAVEIEADNLVLSTAVDAPRDSRKLADMLKVPLNADGFYVEAHVKLRPVDFTTEGIFLCGLAHSPKMMDENISQARAAAARAATVLSKTLLEVGAQVSQVDQQKCISCMTCTQVCPYGAPTVNADRKAEIIAAKCMGCGICAAECPACAIQLNHFESRQFKTMLDELFNVPEEETTKPVGAPQ